MSLRSENETEVRIDQSLDKSFLKLALTIYHWHTIKQQVFQALPWNVTKKLEIRERNTMKMSSLDSFVYYLCCCGVLGRCKAILFIFSLTIYRRNETVKLKLTKIAL